MMESVNAAGQSRRCPEATQYLVDDSATSAGEPLTYGHRRHRQHLVTPRVHVAACQTTFWPG